MGESGEVVADQDGPKLIVGAMKAAGVNFVTSLPDANLAKRWRGATKNGSDSCDAVPEEEGSASAPAPHIGRVPPSSCKTAVS
jgi:hypothetical protein